MESLAGNVGDRLHGKEEVYALKMAIWGGNHCVGSPVHNNCTIYYGLGPGLMLRAQRGVGERALFGGLGDLELPFGAHFRVLCFDGMRGGGAPLGPYV